MQREHWCPPQLGKCRGGSVCQWVSMPVSILKLIAAEEVRYVWCLTFYGARAVNFCVISAMKYYGASVVNNQEAIPTK